MISSDAIFVRLQLFSPLPSVPASELNGHKAVVLIRAAVNHLGRNVRNVGCGCKLEPSLLFCKIVV